MTTTDPTCAALLAAIRAMPDEDTPRLMLADAWEDYDPARAEFIRVQVELGDDRRDAHQARTARLIHRERDLLAANESRWRAGPACRTCGGKRTVGPNPPPAPVYYDCRTCHATGDAGGLMRQVEGFGQTHTDVYRHPVTYHRGLKRVQCRASEVWERIVTQDNHGGYREYHPTAWATACCTHHPDLIEVWVSDMDPYHNVRGFCWYNGARREPRGANPEAYLPMPIFETLDEKSERSTLFPTLDVAHTALARAVVRWVWSAAIGRS